MGAIGWAGASQVQARLGARLSDVAALRAGSVLLLTGLGWQLGVVALQLPGPLVPSGWVRALAWD